MDNLVIIAVAVFLIAIAQGLTIVLTLRREKDIKELGRLVDEQRLHIAELTAWLAGRNAAQARRIKYERESKYEREPKRERPAGAKASEPVIAPRELPETTPSRRPEDEAAQAIKARSWQHQVVPTGLRAGLKGGAVPEVETTRAVEPGATPNESPAAIRPAIPEDKPEGSTEAFRLFKDDEPRDIAAAREIVARLNRATTPAEPAITPKDPPDTMGPMTAEKELERATKAINWLKEDADRAAREILAGGTQPAKKTG